MGCLDDIHSLGYLWLDAVGVKRFFYLIITTHADNTPLAGSPQDAF
jgi:hypothetical protein